jgi:hypothetical protein
VNTREQLNEIVREDGTSSTNDSQTDAFEDLPALVEETPGPVSAQNKEPAKLEPELVPAEVETPGPVSAQNKEPAELEPVKLVPAEVWAAYNDIAALCTPSPRSPDTAWKEEALLLKEELKCTLSIINGVLSALDLASCNCASRTESNVARDYHVPSPSETGTSNVARDYHVPSPSETGTLYVVTKGKQIGVFCGWYVFSFFVDSHSFQDIQEPGRAACQRLQQQLLPCG